ncbi:MAG TPA: polysaccharide deacetylase family protein [Caulobacteraceae bacterium]|nr:polysaccharide deacetylase family protein [Caulobacteraceae bacterium]
MQTPSRRRVLSRVLGLTALMGPVAALGAAPSYSWPNNARGAVSLTYDDGLESQLDQAVPQLQAAGFKATFFLVQENMEARLADWQKVARLGHEIGDHTENHPCSLAHYSVRRFRATQITPMERFLNANFGRSASRPYAYPCGYIGLGEGSARDRIARYTSALGHDFVAARTTVGPPIAPERAWSERQHLAGFEPTYDLDRPELAFSYLNRAMQEGRWAILIFHDVLPKRLGEGDTSVAVHAEILDFIGRRPLWCAPMGEIFGHVAQGGAA